MSETSYQGTDLNGPFDSLQDVADAEFSLPVLLEGGDADLASRFCSGVSSSTREYMIELTVDVRVEDLGLEPAWTPSACNLHGKRRNVSAHLGGAAGNSWVKLNFTAK